MKFTRTVVSFLGASLVLGSSAFGDPNKVAPELKGKSGQAKVIVRYKQAPSGASILNLGLLGGVLNTTVSSVNAVIATIPLVNVEALSNDPSVVYISSDRPLTQLLDYSATAVRATEVRGAGLTGAGVGVAVIDSGIADSLDFGLPVVSQLQGTLLQGILKPLLPSTRVVYHESFISGNGKDDFGHGTHVAGIIAGNGASSNCSNCTRSLIGLAPGAMLIDLRVLDKNGQGSDSTVIAAIDRAIQLKKLFNIRVINLSLGRPVYESYKLDPLCQAVEAAWKAGIVVNVAAGNNGRDNSVGNDGYGTIQSPANDPYVITVGAMKAMGTFSRTDDLIASYSSKGPSAGDFVVKPDLVAPGNHVVSVEADKSTLAADPVTAVPLSYYESSNSSARSSSYMVLNGTSMATPVVSGAVADLLQAEPYLTPDQVKARLMKTAYKTFPTSSTAVDPVTGQTFTSTYDIFTIGAGYLDLAAALANHDVANGTALSPTAAYNASNQTVYLVFDPGSVWAGGNTTVQNPGGASSIWGAQAVWGADSVEPDRAIWGAQAVWGNNTVAGFSTIWGSKGVWGATTDQGTSTVEGAKGVWGATATTSDSDTMFSVKP